MPRKLSNIEASALEFKTSYVSHGSKADPIYKEIGLLNIGEALVVTKEEWPLKSVPNGMSMPKRFRPHAEAKFGTRTLADESGWAVVRLK